MQSRKPIALHNYSGQVGREYPWLFIVIDWARALTFRVRKQFNMPLDTFVEVVARAVGQFVVDVLFVGVFYWPGWVILRTITFGRYPPSQPHSHNREFVAAIGFSAFLVCATLYFSNALI